MPRCLICQHPKRLNIDRLLVDGTPKAVISRTYNVSRDVLRNHEKRHINWQLIKAHAEKENKHTLNLADDLIDLKERAQRILDRTEGEGRDGLALKSIAEARAVIETFSRIAHLVKQSEEQDAERERELQEQKLDRLSLTERRRMLRLVRKMEGRPIDGDSDYSFDDWELEANGGNGKPKKKRRQKIEKEDSDADSGQDSASDEGDESEEEDALPALDCEKETPLLDSDFEDPEGLTMADRMRARPRHEIGNAHLLDVQRERRRWEKRKKISKRDPSGFLDAIASGKIRARTLL